MRYLLLLFAITLASCNEKPEGFQLPGSEFYFQTHSFDNPETLAKASDIEIKRDVVENSPVLADLKKQENDIKIALLYKRATEYLQGNTAPAELFFYIPTAQESIEPILGRLSLAALPNIQTRFEKALDRTTLAALKSTRGNITFTANDFDQRHFAFQNLERRRSLEIAQQVSGHITRRILRAKAKERSKTLQEFSDELVKKENISVSEDDLDNYLDSLGIKREDATASVLERLKSSLLERKKQNFLQRHVFKSELKAPVQIAIERPKAKLVVDESFEPIKGIDEAPISMVVFGSASCTDCAPAINALYKILEEYEGYLRMNWIHFTKSPEGYDGLISEAALCAENQKLGLSFDFLFRFTDTAGQDDDSVFARWIEKDAGGDKDEFKNCLRKSESAALLLRHLNYAKANGVVNTPTVWIEGAMIEGRVTENLVKKEIERVIRERNLSPIKAWLRKWKHRISSWF